MKVAFAFSVAVLLCTVHGIAGEIQDGDIPGLVRLERAGRFQCLGQLIDEQWIVAAARCVDSGVDKVVIKQCRYKQDKLCEMKMPVGRIITHPHWDGKADNDIALVQIKGAVTGFAQMKMANRHRERRAAQEKSKCYTVDWNKGSGMDGQMVMMQWSDCDRQMRGFNIDDPMCSVTNPTNPKGNCKVKRADGNPTICIIGSRMYLFGIHAVKTAAGGRCYNGLTRVSRYLPWFRNIMHVVGRTGVPTGDRCMPHSDGANPCEDIYAECMPGFYSYRCQCMEGYEVVNDQCFNGPRGVLGEECSPEGTCMDPHAICGDNTTICACRQGYHDKGGECLAIRHRLHEGCFVDSDCEDGYICYQNGPSSYYKQMHLSCVCAIGYAHNESDGSCTICPDGQSGSPVTIDCQPLLVKGAPCYRDDFDDLCQNDLVCAPTSTGVYKCQCEPTSRDTGSGCVPCSPGYQRSAINESTCVEKKGMGDACIANEHGQCPEFASCQGQSGRCLCVFGYTLLEGAETCARGQRKALGECTDDLLCTGQDLACVDGRCQCQGGKRPTLHGSCVDACSNDSNTVPCEIHEVGFQCQTICNGIEECQESDLGISLDEYCDVDYASHCMGDVQCDPAMGLVCGPLAMCQCQAGFTWSWPDLRCIMDAQ